MNFVFFGAPIHGLFLMTHRHIPAAIVHSGKEEDDFKLMKSLAAEKKIPLLDPEEVKKPEDLPEYDLLLSMNFHKKIPNQILNAAKMAAVNCHPSLLPELRGANPYFWALRRRHQKAGVSLHHMTDKFDCGNIILQSEIELANAETLGTLYRKLNRLQHKMIDSFILDLKSGASIPVGESQDKDQKKPSKAPKVKKSHLRIDQSFDRENLLNLWKSSRPFYFPWLSLGPGQKIHLRNLSFKTVSKNKSPRFRLSKFKEFSLVLKDGSKFISRDFELTGDKSYFDQIIGEEYAWMV